MEASEVFLSRDERRVVLSFAGLGLIEPGLVQARVDFGGRITLFDALAFLEKHVLQLAVNLSVDRDGIERLHRAKAGEIDRNVGARGTGNADRHSGAGARRVYRIGALRPVPIEQNCGQN